GASEATGGWGGTAGGASRRRPEPRGEETLRRREGSWRETRFPSPRLYFEGRGGVQPGETEARAAGGTLPRGGGFWKSIDPRSPSQCRGRRIDEYESTFPFELPEPPGLRWNWGKKSIPERSRPKIFFRGSRRPRRASWGRGLRRPASARCRRSCSA